jgi:histidyl-tRNA synthetase
MKGTRDFLPEDMYLRERVIGIIKGQFVRYGYQPLATPAMEFFDVLTGKYGEEGEGLIFDLAYKGGKEVALKYDLTVPLCRVIAQYQNEITMPFKRYQIQPVWRAEKPQKGRLREFFQCDADVVGVSDVAADAEGIALVTDIMSALGFSNFVTLINHRKLLSGMMDYFKIPSDKIPGAIRILDKIDKVGETNVREEFGESGYDKKVIDELFSLTEVGTDPLSDLKIVEGALGGNPEAKKGIDDLMKIIRISIDTGIGDKIAFSPRLARGLAYYTGPVYETVVKTPKIGSLAGGGRYDELIGLFSGIDVPATGFALGLERIIQVIAELGLLADGTEGIQVLIVPFGQEELAPAMKIARDLREAGINTDVYVSDDRMKKKLKYADRLGIPKVIIVAPEEGARGNVKLKDMKTGEEKEVKMGEVKNLLSR